MALGDLSGRPNQRDRPFCGLFRVDDGSQPGGQSRAAGDAERISRRELTGCRAAAAKPKGLRPHFSTAVYQMAGRSRVRGSALPTRQAPGARRI